MKAVVRQRRKALGVHARGISPTNVPPKYLVDFVERRFDKHYLRDFIRVYNKSPEEAKKLLKNWQEF